MLYLHVPHWMCAMRCPLSQPRRWWGNHMENTDISDPCLRFNPRLRSETRNSNCKWFRALVHSTCCMFEVNKQIMNTIKQLREQGIRPWDLPHTEATLASWPRGVGCRTSAPIGWAAACVSIDSITWASDQTELKRLQKAKVFNETRSSHNAVGRES